MRVYLTALMLILGSVVCVAQDNGMNELVPVSVLKNKNHRIATLHVPKGFTKETKSSVEGVQTTLTYPDGSYIILHFGGMIKLPLFTQPKHRISERRVLESRVIKYGKVKDKELYWREENSVGTWPPMNIGFTNVPKDRVGLFERSLKSLKRIVPPDSIARSNQQAPIK